MPRGWFPFALHNYTPLLTSAPTPNISSATEAPLICVQMSAALVPYIIGALELYRWRDKWQGTEPQIATAMGVMQDLIDILIAGDNCEGSSVPTDFRFTEACGLEYTNNAGESWIPVPGWTEFASICFQGPPGEQGPTGLPGADGQPVELRVYFGTIQWRVVGEAVWNHLINLSEITGPAGTDGADGPPIELRTFFGTIQWRVVGEAVWNHLINLSDVCDCDEEPVNPNPLTDGLLCAIAYRVAAEIHRIWDYAYTNPSNVITNLADGIGTTAGFFGIIFPGIGLGASAAVAGFVGLMSRIFDNSEANSFTLATEYFIAEQIYCELSRRQQREIDENVLLDIAPHIFEAPDLTDDQKSAVISLILVAPPQAWQWAAYAAAPYPDGTACAGADCENDNGVFWCISLMGDDPTNSESSPLANNPVSKAIVSVERGLLSDIAPIGYEATGGFGYPFLPDITTPYPHRELRLRVDFPRPVQISRLEFLSNYNQTAATATGTRLKVTTGAGTVLINETVSGVASGTAVTDVWFGDETVESLIIEGELWADMAWGGFAGLKLLDFYIQGQGFNPFGSALTNCTWIEPPSDLTPPSHTWTATFSFWVDDYDFTTEAQGSTVPSQTGEYISGLGWKSMYAASGGIEQIYLRLNRAVSMSGVVGIRLLWTRQAASGATTPYVYLGAGGGSSRWNFPNDSHGMRYDLVTANRFGSGIQYTDTVGYETSSGIDWDGSEAYTILHQIKIYGTGTRPAGLAGIPD